MCGVEYFFDLQMVFDVFVENMVEYYIFFDFYEVDWSECVVVG